jgi:hypothetical protein
MLTLFSPFVLLVLITLEIGQSIRVESRLSIL